MKGLSEHKASESNIKRIQVKDIVKEVKDYLKTNSSAGMDISWRETLITCHGGTKVNDIALIVVVIIAFTPFELNRGQLSQSAVQISSLVNLIH
ncbi:hypothetical protein Tco_0697896 [Tanacetum coccineum]